MVEKKKKNLCWLAFFANLLLCCSGSEGCEEEPDPASRFWDELSHVGLPQDLKVQSLFESGKTNNQLFLYYCTVYGEFSKCFTCWRIHQLRRILKFQGNAGHIRVVPCGPTVFARARDNLCLMWTEPLTQGAQRWVRENIRGLMGVNTILMCWGSREGLLQWGTAKLMDQTGW